MVFGDYGGSTNFLVVFGLMLSLRLGLGCDNKEVCPPFSSYQYAVTTWEKTWVEKLKTKNGQSNLKKRWCPPISGVFYIAILQDMEMKSTRNQLEYLTTLYLRSFHDHIFGQLDGWSVSPNFFA